MGFSPSITIPPIAARIGTNNCRIAARVALSRGSAVLPEGVAEPRCQDSRGEGERDSAGTRARHRQLQREPRQRGTAPPARSCRPWPRAEMWHCVRGACRLPRGARRGHEEEPYSVGGRVAGAREDHEPAECDRQSQPFRPRGARPAPKAPADHRRLDGSKQYERADPRVHPQIGERERDRVTPTMRGPTASSPLAAAAARPSARARGAAGRSHRSRGAPR